MSLTLATGLFACTGIFAARGRQASVAFIRAQDQLSMNPDDQAAANDRDRAEFDSKQSQTGGIACAALGSVMLAGGVAMVTTGAILRKRAKRVAAAPTFSRSHAGAVLRVRF